MSDEDYDEDGLGPNDGFDTDATDDPLSDSPSPSSPSSMEVQDVFANGMTFTIEATSKPNRRGGSPSMREPAEPAEPTPGRTAAPMAAAPLNALDAPSLQRTWSPNDKVAAKLPRFSGWWSGHVHSMRPSGDVRVVWEGSLSWSDVKNVTTSIMGADEAERDGIAVQVDAAPHSPSTTPAAAATAAPRTAAATASAAPVAPAAPAAVTAAAVAAPAADKSHRSPKRKQARVSAAHRLARRAPLPPGPIADTATGDALRSPSDGVFEYRTSAGEVLHTIEPRGGSLSQGQMNMLSPYVDLINRAGEQGGESPPQWKFVCYQESDEDLAAGNWRFDEPLTTKLSLKAQRLFLTVAPNGQLTSFARMTFDVTLGPPGITGRSFIRDFVYFGMEEPAPGNQMKWLSSYAHALIFFMQNRGGHLLPQFCISVDEHVMKRYFGKEGALKQVRSAQEIRPGIFAKVFEECISPSFDARRAHRRSFRYPRTKMGGSWRQGTTVKR